MPIAWCTGQEWNIGFNGAEDLLIALNEQRVSTDPKICIVIV